MSSSKGRLRLFVEKAYTAIRSRQIRFAKARQEMNDNLEGREYLGKDKFDNQYFQYFGHHGLPTRRRVYYKFFSGNKFHIDVHFLDWLYHRKSLPPSPHELETLYLKDEERMKKAFEWDKQEEKKQLAYKEKIAKVGLPSTEQVLQQLEEQANDDNLTIEQFKPVPWKVVAETKAELKKYVPPEDYKQELLKLESELIDEHNRYQGTNN